eukprot:TRINITY_DN91452_c0_g1_i1.p1 TRINITY_DN91452_c0_g1~~TRINITY_DN91452_c0_g1_i1.p1  ORF type:complete len:662 (+),score=136.21 TRINITY_DN91452_c0_g1_i1:85-2070(+)
MDRVETLREAPSRSTTRSRTTLKKVDSDGFCIMVALREEIASVKQVLRDELVKLRQDTREIIRSEAKDACKKALASAPPPAVSHGWPMPSTIKEDDDHAAGFGRPPLLRRASMMYFEGAADCHGGTRPRALIKRTNRHSVCPISTQIDIAEVMRLAEADEQETTNGANGEHVAGDSPRTKRIVGFEMSRGDDDDSGSDVGGPWNQHDIREYGLLQQYSLLSRKSDLTDTEDEEQGSPEPLLKRQVSEEEPNPMPLWMRMVRNAQFDYAVGLTIIANLFWTGIQTEYISLQYLDPVPVAFRCIDTFFVSVFATELLLRSGAYGETFYLYVQNNSVDTGVIVLLALDQVVALVCSVFGFLYVPPMPMFTLGILRLLRLFRLIRILSTGSILEKLRELRMMIVPVVDCMKSLIWSSVFILMVTFVFSVLLTTWVMRVKQDVFITGGDTSRIDDLDKYFGSLAKTTLVLTQSILSGLSWGVVIDALLHHKAFLAVFFFLLYICICMLGVLNMVTGVFMAAVMKRVTQDQKVVLEQRMQTFFKEADDDGSGTITFEEFSKYLKDESMQRFLEEIDLTVDNARDLFYLLDVDETGEIPVGDVVDGCLQLHGAASALDLRSFVRTYEKDADMHLQKLDMVLREVMLLGSKFDDTDIRSRNSFASHRSS